MKAIIQAYSPEEVERIACGEQTIKVCKTAPKETPFKVYMYKKPYAGGAKIINEVLNGVYSGGKVVGEYVCKRVEECIPDYNPITQEFYYNDWEDCSADHLTSEEETAYGKGKTLRGLHITTAKFYDEPKPLNLFKIACNKSIQCNLCEYRALVWHEDKKDFYYECRRPAITHAPRGWQYVEELNYEL